MVWTSISSLKRSSLELLSQSICKKRSKTIIVHTPPVSPSEKVSKMTVQKVAEDLNKNLTQEEKTKPNFEEAIIFEPEEPQTSRRLSKLLLGKKMSKDFRCVGKIGHGAFSQVFHCICKNTKEHVAVKE